MSANSSAAAAPQDLRAVTIFTTVDGSPCNKLVTRAADGSITKGMIRHRQHYRAEQRDAHDLPAFADVVREIGDRAGALFTLSLFDDPPAPRWQTMSCDQLSNLTGCTGADLARWHTIGGDFVTVRIAEVMHHGAWLGVEFDDDPEQPTGWAGMSLAEKCGATDVLIPSFATCGKVITRSTSTRVTVDGTPLASAAHHVFVQVAEPALIGVKWRMAQWRALISEFQLAPWDDPQPLAYPKRRHSHKDPTKVVGVDWRTIYDRCTGHVNRLWFDGAPTVRGAGLAVLPATVEVFDGPPLDLAMIPDLTKEEWQQAAEAVRRVKGVKPSISLKRSGTKGRHSPVVGVTILVRDLSRDTDVELADGSWTTFGAWADGGETHSRCQSPFRDSDSEAAFLGRHGDGSAFLFDSGTGEKHMLDLSHNPTIGEMLVDWVVADFDPRETDAAGGSIYSGIRQTWIETSKIKIPLEILDVLCSASNAPVDDKTGLVKPQAVAALARQTLPHAMATLINTLPVADNTALADQVAALLRHPVYGEGPSCSLYAGRKRALGSWLHFVASRKTGEWVRFAPYEAMARVFDDGGFQVAIRRGLAHQLSSVTHAAITAIHPDHFTRRCNQAGIGDDSRDNVFGEDGKRERWTLLKAEFLTRLDLDLDHAADAGPTFTEEAKAAARESEGKGFFRKPN